MFSFTHPYLLLLLLFVPLAAIYIARFRRNPSIRVASAEPFGGVEKRGARGKFRWRNLTLADLFKLAALALLLLAMAQPRYGNDRYLMRSEGIDIVLALDLSGSMQLYDLPPGVNSRSAIISGVRNGTLRDRLAIAKEALVKFVEARPNDRFGLIGFSEAAYSFAPPTLDHGLIIDLIDELNLRMLHSSATGIASPIISGVKRLSGTGNDCRKVLVLFTDGDNNVRHAATPLEAAELAKAKDVAIYTVGIGSDNGVAVMEFGNMVEIQQARGSFNEPMLREIARITGGKYFEASDEQGLSEVMDEINRLEKTSTELPRITDFHHYAPNLALAALALMLVGAALECTLKLRLP